MVSGVLFAVVYVTPLFLVCPASSSHSAGNSELDNESLKVMAHSHGLDDGDNIAFDVVGASIFVVLTFENESDPIATPPLIISHPGVYATGIIARSSGTTHPLRWEVIRSGESRCNTVIVFESALTVVDGTSSEFALRISFGRQGRNEIVERVVAPQHPIHLPALSSSTSMMQIRPRELQFDFGPSLLFNDISVDANKQTYERLYECPSIGGRRSPLALRVRVRRRVELRARGRCITLGLTAVRSPFDLVSLSNNSRLSVVSSSSTEEANNFWCKHVIELHAVVVLLNALPQTLLVRIQSRAPGLQRARVHDAALEPGDTMHLFEKKSSMLHATFRFGETFDWSAAIRLKLRDEKRRHKALLRLTPNGTSERRLSLVEAMSRRVSNRGAKRKHFFGVCVETQRSEVVVYVDMLLIDSSGFNLVYKLGDSPVRRIRSETFTSMDSVPTFTNDGQSFASISASSNEHTNRSPSWNSDRDEKDEDESDDSSYSSADQKRGEVAGDAAFDIVRPSLVSDEARYLTELDERDRNLLRHGERLALVASRTIPRSSVSILSYESKVMFASFESLRERCLRRRGTPHRLLA
jgi:hypothetical protein